MKLIFHIVFLLLMTGCAKDQSAADMEHSMEDHAAMVMDSDAPAAGDYSLYQVTSEWLNQDGNSLKLSSLAGQIQVVAMTYTSCEISCPRIVASMKHIKSSTDVDAAFVLISIDPDRDTVETLSAYALKMEMQTPDWNLLTGAADDVREMAALLGVRFRKTADGEFAHSNIVTVLDETGSIVYQQKGLGAKLTAETIDFLSQ